MKDPTGEHDMTPYKDQRGQEFNICYRDGESWPCPAVVKLRGSKKFRINELITLTDSLAKSAAVADNRIASLEDTVEALRSELGKRDEAYLELKREITKTNVIQEALLMSQRDIQPLAPIEIAIDLEYVDVTPMISGFRQVKPSHVTTRVTYKDRTWMI